MSDNVSFWVESGLFLIAAAVILYGLLTASAMLYLSGRGHVALRMLAICLLLLCLTIGHEALLLAGWYDAHSFYRFWPASFSLAIGPVFFLYVKARLYPNFRLKWSDSKHFLGALAQASAYIALFVQPLFRKEELWHGLYRYYIHPLENLLFVITGWIYLYFAYRFVKYELAVRQHPTSRLEALRLKRTAKVQFLFLTFYAAYLIDDTIRRLLLLKAQTDLTWVSWFSFSALLGMLAWLSLFAWLSEYWWPRRHKLNLTRFVKKILARQEE
ncbi:MAG: hypothetical protein KA479_12515 [Saprospiraceae bacterium]|nr:hypothetical protein [Saprospiraceae bacterium]